LFNDLKLKSRLVDLFLKKNVIFFINKFCYVSRFTIFVLIGNLKRIEFNVLTTKVLYFSKQEISHNNDPPFIFADQKFIGPLPLPILTSIGFLVTQICAKTHKMTRPFFFTFFFKLLYNIINCLDVIREKCNDFNPNCPYRNLLVIIVIFLNDFPF